MWAIFTQIIQFEKKRRILWEKKKQNKSIFIKHQTLVFLLAPRMMNRGRRDRYDVYFDTQMKVCVLFDKYEWKKETNFCWIKYIYFRHRDNAVLNIITAITKTERNCQNYDKFYSIWIKRKGSVRKLKNVFKFVWSVLCLFTHSLIKMDLFDVDLYVAKIKWLCIYFMENSIYVIWLSLIVHFEQNWQMQ